MSKTSAGFQAGKPALGSLHPLQQSILKVPRGCHQVSKFNGPIKQMPKPVNADHWHGVIRAVDQTLVPFKERLEWAATLIFLVPAHKSTMWHISHRARTDQNLYLASRRHDFVLFTRTGKSSDGRRTFVEVRGQRMKLSYWLAVNAKKRAQLWGGRVQARDLQVEPTVSVRVAGTVINALTKERVKILTLTGRKGSEIVGELGISVPSVMNIRRELGLAKLRPV